MDKNKLAQEYARSITGQFSSKNDWNIADNFLAGFDACLAELSKSGDFREFCICDRANLQGVVYTHIKDPKDNSWDREKGDIHVIDIQALAAANAKLAEKDAKITELEAKLKAADEVIKLLRSYPNDFRAQIKADEYLKSRGE